VEFFSDGEEREYGFVKESFIQTLVDSNIPRKPAKRFLSALDAARRENQCIEEIREVFVHDVCHPYSLSINICVLVDGDEGDQERGTAASAR
jgi:hypothetical protein